MGRVTGEGGILRRLVEFLSFLSREHRAGLILLLALLNGLLYLFLVPPWQHYDEPGHFEYAWLIADRGRLPQAGDYDPAMRREMTASMVEHAFFRGMGFTPSLLAQDDPVWIPQVGGDPPLYYMLVALPLRLVRFADMAVQLRVARGMSLLLYVLSVWLAGKIVAELVGEGHLLRWAVPGMVALLPAYTDLMTAVNNDVGAVVMFSLFLWGAVRAIARGFSWPRLIWVVGTAALCVWTKNTAAVAVLLTPLAVLLAVFRGRRWWLALVGYVVVGLAVVTAAVGWGDAALWYRQTDQEIPTRQERVEAPLGEAALALEMTPHEPGRSLVQPLLEADVEALRGQTVTLGAWIWASEPVQVRSPILNDGRHTWEPVEVGETPAFFAITATVATDAERIGVILRPLVDRTLAQTVTVWYDGLVLVEGARSLDRSPAFDGPEGREGTWGGEPFVNRVRNGSAEAAWPRVREWAEEGLRKYGRRSLEWTLASVLDWGRTAWVYRVAGLNLFRSFWATFGWNHVDLPVGWYWGLGVVTVLGVLGALVAWVRLWWSNRPPPWKGALGLLAVAGLLVWGNALLRPHPLMGKPFIPAARYAYPAIVPTVLALAGGWLAWVPRRTRIWVVIGLLSGLALLDAVSLVTIWTFYRR